MPNRPKLGRRLRGVLLIVTLIAAVIASSALAASKTVNVGDSYFSPKNLSIGHGTTVTFKWVGALLHNVKVRTGPAKFKSREQIHGTYSYRFSARGTYKLYCTLHPNMTMTVVVH